MAVSLVFPWLERGLWHDRDLMKKRVPEKILFYFELMTSEVSLRWTFDIPLHCWSLKISLLEVTVKLYLDTY